MFFKSRNFWFVLILGGVAALMLFDRNNIFERRRIVRNIEELEQVRRYYRDLIRSDSILIERLASDDAYLEQYAREEYLMRRDSDYVFIVR